MEFHIQDPDDPGGVYLLDAIVSACEDAERGGGIFSFASPNGAKLLLEDKTFRNFLKRGPFALVIGIDAVTTVTALDVISAISSFTYTLDAAGCGLGGSLGLQYSAGEGFHPYYGGGITTCAAAASFTVAPDQSITSGANCGVQGSFLAPTPWVVGIGPTGQFGAAPLEDKEGNIDFFSADAEPFGEIGVSVGLPYGVGVSATCIRVLDVPFLSW